MGDFPLSVAKFGYKYTYLMLILYFLNSKTSGVQSFLQSISQLALFPGSPFSPVAVISLSRFVASLITFNQIIMCISKTELGPRVWAAQRGHVGEGKGITNMNDLIIGLIESENIVIVN